MKKLLFIVFFVSTIAHAQNNYTTIVLPKKFDIFKRENQYNINDLCKSFFEKEGFTVLNQSDLTPEKFYNTSCNALYVDLEDNGTILNTKIIVFLKDCKNNTVLKSNQFTTKEKDYNLAYNEVVRKALTDLRGKLTIPNTTVEVKTAQNNTIQVVKTTQNKLDENLNPDNYASVQILLARPTQNGFILTDENKNTIYELLKTSNPSIFNAKKGITNGVLTLNGTKATFEYYQNDILVIEQLEIKF